MAKRLLPLAVIAGLTVSPALAETETERHEVAGHLVRLIETDDFMRVLEVDGKVLREDGLILLDPPQEVAGLPVLTGVAGPGGNACGGAHFVLVLAQGQPARLDGPIDSCTEMEMRAEAEGLTFHAPAQPGIQGESWRWTPAEGLVQGTGEEFAPDAGRGWATLPELAGAHPADALRLQPVYDALKQGMAPEDFAQFQGIITGLGSGDLVPQGYRGEACDKMTCDETYAVLWLDAAQEQVFALWTDEAGALRSLPEDRADWPDWITADLPAAQ